MFKRVEVAPAYKIVFKALEKEILNGRIPIGHALPTETELARQFGVTRHTVREGIRILEETGVVRRQAGRRLHVAVPHATESGSRTSRALMMQKVSFRELWEVAKDLECAAASRAAARATEDVLVRLRANVADMEATLLRGQSIIPLDIQFHTLVAEATGNKVLLLAREPVSALFYPALETLFSHPHSEGLAPARMLDAHKRIMEGFENRDPALAHEWMAKHMTDFHRGYAICGLDMDEPVDHGHHP